MLQGKARSPVATCPLPLGMLQDTSVLFSPRYLQLCSGVMGWPPLYLQHPGVVPGDRGCPRAQPPALCPCHLPVWVTPKPWQPPPRPAARLLPLGETSHGLASRCKRSLGYRVIKTWQLPISNSELLARGALRPSPASCRGNKGGHGAGTGEGTRRCWGFTSRTSSSGTPSASSSCLAYEAGAVRDLSGANQPVWCPPGALPLPGASPRVAALAAAQV